MPGKQIIKKPALHQSQLAVLLRCGEQYRRIYLMKQRVPPDVAKLIGTATHKSIEKNLNYKIDHKGRLMPISHIKDIARDAFVKSWSSEPIKLSGDDQILGLSKVKGAGIDWSVKLSALHHKKLAPKIFPRKGGVERAWTIPCPGYPFDLAGTMDIDEEVPGRIKIRRVRDTKTKGKSPTQSDIDTSFQFTLYGMAVEILDRVKVDEFVMDALVKTKTPKAISLVSRRGIEHYRAFKALFERACSVIQKEAFTPCNPQSWYCGPKWCGFYRGDPERGIAPCPFVSGVVSIGVNGVKKEEGVNNGTGKTVGKDGSKTGARGSSRGPGAGSNRGKKRGTRGGSRRIRGKGVNRGRVNNSKKVSAR